MRKFHPRMGSKTAQLAKGHIADRNGRVYYPRCDAHVRIGFGVLARDIWEEGIWYKDKENAVTFIRQMSVLQTQDGSQWAFFLDNSGFKPYKPL